MNTLAIIGLDPGTTTGYAVLDLEGNILKTFSAKELSLSETISQIMELSTPLVVGTDKARVPGFVDKFARKIGAILVHPTEDLKKEEKRELIKVKFKSQHENDSLAAAVYAYKKYHPKIEKIKRFIEDNQLHHKEQEFTKIALTENLNLQLIKNILTKPSPENKIVQDVIHEDKITKKSFLALYETLDRSKQEKIELENKLEKFKKNISVMNEANRRLGKKSNHVDQKIKALFKFKEERLKLQEKEIKNREELIHELNIKIISLHLFIEKTPKLQLVKKLNDFSKKEFNEKNKVLDLQENDVMLVNDPNFFSEEIVGKLKEKSMILLSPKKTNKLISNSFLTVLFKDQFELENEYFALLSPEILEKKLNRKDFIEQIITEHKQRRIDEKEN